MDSLQSALSDLLLLATRAEKEKEASELAERRQRAEVVLRVGGVRKLNNVAAKRKDLPDPMPSASELSKGMLTERCWGVYAFTHFLGLME